MRTGFPRTSLAFRMALLAVVVVLLTSVAAGLVSVNLLQSANEQAARRNLAALADSAQANAAIGSNADAGQARARRALANIKVQIATIRRADPGEPVLAGDQLARRALTPQQVQTVLDGTPMSLQLPTEDGFVLVEARPTSAGGLVLAQRRTDALALGQRVVVELGWALAATAVAAMGIGLVVAWRLSLPLKRTAAAAQALADGRRDVAVPLTGPQEVADVAGSLNRLATALSHSEARQREFLLSVSHDLRTPLTAITGYAESLTDGVVPAGQVSSVAAVMADEAHRLERLVADLLDLARLDAHEMSIHPVTADLNVLVRTAATTWARRCAEAGVVFRLETGTEPLPVVVDPQRLRQAVDGLLENALRVTPQGAPIILAARTEAGLAVLEVRDGGPGLTDDDLPVAFDRSVLYERYRGIRQVGTGLGLAIVHRIATRLGAGIEAGHAVEGGARFTLRMRLQGS